MTQTGDAMAAAVASGWKVVTSTPKKTTPDGWAAVPAVMKDAPRWVVWRLETRGGNQTKIPYNPRKLHRRASSTDPGTWSTFAEAARVVEFGFHGLGFVLGCDEETGRAWLGVDWDHKRNDRGEWEPGTLEEILSLRSYGELSPSGTGAHVIAWGEKPGGDCRRGDLEIYDSGRFFTVTGEHIDGTPTEIRDVNPEALSQLYAKVAREPAERSAPEIRTCRNDSEPGDDKLIEMIRRSKQGSKFDQLFRRGDWNGYDSRSEGVMALCDLFTWWTHGDPAWIDRLMRQSAIIDPEKWDRLAPREIQNALRTVVLSDSPPWKAGRPNLQPDRAEVKEEDGEQQSATEDRISLDVRLDPSNFVVQYIHYGLARTDAYPEYHAAAAISLLSLACQKRACLKMQQQYIFPNVWSFILGPSTVSRKSTVVSHAGDFARFIAPHQELPQSFSPEGFIEEMSSKPKAWFFRDEAAGLLASMEKKYMSDMRDLLCELYEGKDYRRTLRKGQRKDAAEFRITDPYLVQLYATTPDAFKARTEILDLTSGWLVRFLYFAPDYRKARKPFEPLTDESKRLHNALLQHLKRVYDLFMSRDREIEFVLSEEALQAFQTWQMEREAGLIEDDSTSDIELAFFGRMVPVALKLAILFRVGGAEFVNEASGQRGLTQYDTIEIGTGHIREACRQIDEYFFPTSLKVARMVAMEETQNLQNRIISTLQRYRGKIKRPDLLRALHMRLKDVDEALEALQESEEIEIVEKRPEGKRPYALICLKGGV